MVGFLGLLPPTRAFIRKLAMKRIDRAVKGGSINVVGFQRGGTWHYSNTPPSPDAPPQWQGTPRDIPRYTDEPGAGDGAS